jgi:hypothetical protein
MNWRKLDSLLSLLGTKDNNVALDFACDNGSMFFASAILFDAVVVAGMLREFLLYAFGFCKPQDGNPLESKLHRKSAEESSFFQTIGFFKKFHTIKLTLP